MRINMCTCFMFIVEIFGVVLEKKRNDDNYVPYELDDSDSDDIHIDRNEGENNIESVKDNVNLESDNINIGVIF